MGIKNAFARENLPFIPLATVGLAKGVYEEVIRPNPGTVAWAALGAYVVGYEVLCPAGHTLSETVDRAIDHSTLAKAAVLGTIGVISLHLANVIPQRWDPLHQLTIFGKG